MVTDLPLVYSGFSGAHVIPSNKAAEQTIPYSKQLPLYIDIMSFIFRPLLLNHFARFVALFNAVRADICSSVSASI